MLGLIRQVGIERLVLAMVVAVRRNHSGWDLAEEVAMMMDSHHN